MLFWIVLKSKADLYMNIIWHIHFKESRLYVVVWRAQVPMKQTFTPLSMSLIGNQRNDTVHPIWLFQDYICGFHPCHECLFLRPRSVTCLDYISKFYFFKRYTSSFSVGIAIVYLSNIVDDSTKT